MTRYTAACDAAYMIAEQGASVEEAVSFYASRGYPPYPQVIVNEFAAAVKAVAQGAPDTLTHLSQGDGPMLTAAQVVDEAELWPIVEAVTGEDPDGDAQDDLDDD